MLNYFQRLGASSINILERLGRASIFFANILLSIPSVLIRPRLLFSQMYSVGVLSFSLIVISGLFVGMVLALQGFYTLSDFGAEGMLGVMVAASLVRELGPVVAAIICWSCWLCFDCRNWFNESDRAVVWNGNDGC